ncbi:MAG: sulfur carrier protein ThiS [Phycisphaerae bacterium]|nr:sulfur carrier protein ThiS [Phycisphaerae bacterium]
MRLVINGQERQMEPDTTVSGLVSAFGLNPRHVAVEVNCELVPRRVFNTAALREGDRVEIVTLVGGG